MNASLKRQLLKTFAQMVADLKNPAEVERFLVDFFDPEELEKYVKRISAAYWLKKNRTIDNIKTNLKTSPLDLNEAKRFLQSSGGKLAIKYMEAEEFANVWSEKIKKVIK